MERDFLGLSSKESLAAVKEELEDDGCKESGYAMGAGIHWPFHGKVSALPQLMSIKGAQEDRIKKAASDVQVAGGFMPVSNGDAFDPSQKRSSGEFQKSFNHSRQGGTHFSLTAYSVHPPHDVKMFPVCDQAVSLSMGSPFFKNHFVASSQSLTGASMKQQLVGVTAAAASIPSLPSAVPIGRATDLWSGLKSSGSTAQLTIFYGGSVCVYDDISPEKAQAIMFLAGNGTSAFNTVNPKAQAQAPISKLGMGEGHAFSQPMSAPPTPSSGHSSPLSVSSYTGGAQSVGGSTNTDEPMGVKLTGLPTSAASKMEPPKIVSGMRTVAAAHMVPTEVPQARKASLARFLEKRRERVMNAAPYNCSKKSAECANTEPSGTNFSATSTSVSCSQNRENNQNF